MSKQNENGIISLYSASEELGKQLIKLYKSKSFTRTGKDLANSLFNTGIEAGSLISGISEVTDRHTKIETANKAILKLNQTLYIANIMQMADFYRPAQVRPLISYIGKIIDGLRELLQSVPSTQRRIVVKNPVGTINPAQKSNVTDVTEELEASVAVTGDLAALPEETAQTSQESALTSAQESAQTDDVSPVQQLTEGESREDGADDEYIEAGWEEKV